MLIPYERLADIEPYICCLKPCAVDPDEAPDVPDPVDVCFLIGGPSGTHSYAANHWARITELADAAARRFRTGVFTSRRTPAQVFRQFKQQESPNLRVFGSEDINSGGVMDFCKKARMVLVTEDSNSMITEAVCCRKPVCVLGPASNGMNANEAAYLEGLEAKNWLYSQSLDADISFETLCEKIEDLSPMQENHLDVLAGKLLGKLTLAAI
ncbi:MAG: ELM1/GtrOC1 family putative glycosyltransferase [Rhodomicrobiaceae bacterium]